MGLEAQSASGTRAAGCPSRGESGSREGCLTASAKLGKKHRERTAGWACAKALKLGASLEPRKAQCDCREMSGEVGAGSGEGGG